MAGRSDEAEELFDAMETGGAGDGVKPGLSCYNAILLSRVRSRTWEDALSVYEAMKQSAIEPDPSTVQGVILASYRMGGKEHVQFFLKEMLSSKARLDKGTFELAAKILLPVVKGNTSDVRKKLREICDQTPSLRSVSLDLMRSIRIAEVEQERQASEVLRIEEIQQKREESWHCAMIHLIDYVQASNQQN
jgi:pentatricopeptide repeat protein